MKENKIEYYFNEGVKKYNAKDFEGAKVDFTKAIELDPNFVAAYTNRGFAKHKLKEFEGAKEDFTKAIELDPNLVEAFISRGLAKYGSEDFKGAVEDYTKAIELNPNKSELFNIYFFRGFAQSKLNKNIEAIEDYTNAIELDSNYSEIYFYIAVLKIKLNKNIEAKEYYKKAFKTCFENKKNEHTYKRILKFRPINIHTLHSIINDEIWFAHPTKFNDPMDGSFLQKYIYNQGEIKDVLNSILVASLVQEQTNPAINNDYLMWPHYSKNHTGICLVYEFVQNEIENNEYFIDILNYTDKLPKPTFDNLGSIIKEGFFTKYKIWEYENEIRILYLLKENENSDGMAIPLNKLGLQLKEIIFGLKCTEKDKKTFCEIIKNKPKLKVDFFEMKEQNPAIEIDNHFLIDKVPYNLK